ncbi:MAG: 50S ribosomal protein L11 methyltransferase [Flavobacteriales bacterium]|nr:50S ribosomal protein L11 methyltransferase [Flavobacteriales bacterium]
MRYLALTFLMEEGDPRREVIMADFDSLPIETVTDDASGLMAYIPENAFTSLDDIKFPLANAIETVTFDHAWIAYQNWNAIWESQFEPIAIKQALLLRAPFHDDAKDEDFTFVIEMMPKMAFGTGHHPTTYLMLERMLNEPVNGLRMLDMGCGTAVLSVMGCLQKASQVVGIELDAHAADNAREIVLNNGVEAQCEILTGDASLLETQAPFDVIYANINRNVLLADLPAYAMVSKDGTMLHLSGFYPSDVAQLKARAKDCGYHPLSEAKNQAWMQLTLRYDAPGDS